MKMSQKAKKAITLSEAMITMVIFGIIAIVVVPILLYHNPMKSGNETMARKTAEVIEQAAVQIIANNSIYDNYTYLKDKNGYFSIEDADAKDRMPVLFKEYLNYLDLKIDLNHEFYNKELKDVKKHSLGITLKDAYSGFFWNQSGAIIAFRFYEGCTNTEQNANPPEQKGVFAVENICGSIFYDSNGYKKPNLIGNDQYILPINKRGIIYTNE